jgi:hypothetical protein
MARGDSSRGAVFLVRAAHQDLQLQELVCVDAMSTCAGLCTLRLQAKLDGLGGAEFPRMGEAHRKRVLAARLRSSSQARRRNFDCG